MNDALGALARAAAAHDGARAAAGRASDARALAAALAHRAGASYGVIAGALGVSRPTALELVRTGEALVGAATPALVPSRDTPPPATCLREHCPHPAADGARFCAAHRWT